MKWVFLLGLVVLVPLLTGWLRQYPRHAPKVWAVMGFLPFVLVPWNLYIAPVSWFWPGFVKGMEISILDAVALAILLSRPRTRLRLPFTVPFAVYFFMVLASALQANAPQASLFYAWQLLRVFLVFAAVTRVCEDERGPRALISGLVLGLALQAAIALGDRVSGAIQTGGNFGHQNLLGMTSHFVALPALGLLMAGGRGWAPVMGPAAAIVTAILGASRATIGFSGLGFLSVIILSGLRRWTGRKAVVIFLGCLVVAGAAPLALASLDRRFAVAMPVEDYDERAALEEATWMIIRDYPLGVGANQFVIVANTRGYLEEAEVAPTHGSRGAHVHNVYLLVAAETGIAGLAAFLALLIAPLSTALRFAWRYRSDKRGDLLLGLGIALAIASLHSLYEWIFVTFQVQYVFAMAVGLIAGLVRQIRSSKREQPPRVPNSVASGPLVPPHAG